MKPKLWDGANAVGEAKERHLQTIDAPYLTASGPGFTAHKAGSFSDVTGAVPTVDTSEDALFCTGWADGEVKKRGAVAPGKPFRHSTVLLRAYNLGNGYSASIWESEGAHVIQTVYRRVFNRLDETDAWMRPMRFYAGELQHQFYKRGFIGAISASSHSHESPGGGPGYFTGTLVPLGRKSKTDQARSLFIHPVQREAVDGWGFPTYGLDIYATIENCTSAYYLPLPIPEEFLKGGARTLIGCLSFVFSPGCCILFAAVAPLSAPYAPSLDNIGFKLVNEEDASEGHNIAPTLAQGKILQYMTVDGGASWSVLPFTGLDFLVYPDPHTEEGDDPTTSTAGTTYLGRHWVYARPNCYDDTYGRVSMQQIRMEDFLVTGSAAVFRPDTYTVFCSVTDNRRYGGDLVGLRTFILRTTDYGVTWTKVETPLDEDVPLKPYDCSSTILRDGVCLVRCAHTLSGLGRALRFIRTYDMGATYEEVAFTGISNVSDHVGYPEVLRVYEEDGQMRTKLAITGYDDAEQAYFLYLSTDDGTTWEVSRKIASSEVFTRCDSDAIYGPYSDPSASFGRLDYRGTHAKPMPLDIGAPWIYDALVPPPAD